MDFDIVIGTRYLVAAVSKESPLRHLVPFSDEFPRVLSLRETAQSGAPGTGRWFLAFWGSAHE